MARKVPLTHRPPNSDELARLEPFKRSEPVKKGRKGRILQWQDPITDNVYSARQVQIARAGGITPEVGAFLSRTGRKKIAKRAQERGEHLYYLANKYARNNGKKLHDVWRDEKFWKAVKALDSKGTSPRGPKARALVALGLRGTNDPWRVGSSPKSIIDKSDPSYFILR